MEAEKSQRGEGHMKTEAEGRVIWPQAKECRRPPKAREERNRIFLRVSGGNVVQPILSFGFLAVRTETE